MCWQEVLKNSRLSQGQKGKSINIDSVAPIESNDESCFEKVVEFISDNTKTKHRVVEDEYVWETAEYTESLTTGYEDEIYCSLLEYLELTTNNNELTRINPDRFPIYVERLSQYAWGAVIRNTEDIIWLFEFKA